MKPGIILTVVWTGFCLCERRERATVLTDESKRVVEHFDFSNFDKQEALNYLDRQRFENQIRGKRSHCKSKRDRPDVDQNADVDTETNEVSVPEESNIEAKPEILENNPSASPDGVCESPLQPTERAKQTFTKRHGRRLKKKRKNSSLGEINEENNEKIDERNEDRRKDRRKKKKTKKKKKKKRHYWDKWTEWSPCSVTCGRGRKIRWRKCIAKNCTTGELEMGEKTCQLPACNLLTKLLGL